METVNGVVALGDSWVSQVITKDDGSGRGVRRKRFITLKANRFIRVQSVVFKLVEVWSYLFNDRNTEPFDLDNELIFTNMHKDGVMWGSVFADKRK